MLGALVADALRSVAWSVPATLPHTAQTHVATTVVSSAIGAAIILAVALRQRWAAILYGILVCIGASLILVVRVPGASSFRSLFDWATAVAEVAGVCLLFSQTARDFCRPVPGSQGLKIAVTLSVAIVVISAMLLH